MTRLLAVPEPLGAAGAMRWLLLVGRRLVLGLRLGPLSSPDHVLGWKLADRGPDWVRLDLRSWMLGGEVRLRI